MLNKNVNKKAIEDVYKNAQIALQSISDILPAVKDRKLKQELKDEYEGYEKTLGEVASFMSQNSIPTKEINIFKKLMLASSIKTKTFFNSSKNQIAEMMIKGTVTGVNELTAMKNEKQNLDPQVVGFIDKLLSLEKSYEENLRKYL